MIEKLRAQINEYFVGKENVTENVLICLLAGGHVLIEDVPGVGKTTLARVLSGSVDMSFGRIQFTPDTLPGDIVGLSVYNMKTGEFEYKEGAIMRQMILADEINRTSPKTQASLLEAMAEGSVTVDDVTYILPEPFMVIATQNPSGFVGTYPLPEAQLDRFMMKLSIGYPDTDTQMRLTRNQLEGKTADTVESVLNASDIIRMKEEAGGIKVVDPVLKYASDIIDNTRNEKGFTMGASPRAMIMLIRASQAKAYMEGRDHVTPDDIKAVSVNVLHHRVSLSYEAKARRENIDSLIYSNVLKAKVPFD
jgi:MoxR-like ATPase